MLCFEDCVVDPATRSLWRMGQAVPLQPKVMDLLLYLVADSARYMSKDELKSVLWPSLSVGPTSLPRLVKELRKATGDGRRFPRVIRTLHGRGYQFIAAVRHVDGVASFHDQKRIWATL